MGIWRRRFNERWLIACVNVRQKFELHALLED
jgi:hypothetical protein